MISTEQFPVSPAQIDLGAQLPKPPPGMRYVLVPEQQVLSSSLQAIPLVQQQRFGGNECYICGAVAIERCNWIINGTTQCRNMMCLQHMESMMRPYLGRCNYCQEHVQAFISAQNVCCAIL
jgi:hypothetical protein